MPMFHASAFLGGSRGLAQQEASQMRLVDVPRRGADMMPAGYREPVKLDRSSSPRPPKKLSALMKEFFQMVESRDVQGVVEFMASNPNFDANVLDYNGNSALVEAVKNEDQELVHFFLQLPNIELHDALLHAVNSGNEGITNIILDYYNDNGLDAVVVFPDSVEFPPEITPLILAAHNGNYAIIQLLLEYGHYLEKPHQPDCFCKEKCNSIKSRGETLLDCTSRYKSYKALATPALICQTSHDPILTSFRLSCELKHCAEKEPELRQEYLDLSEACSKLPVDLLDQCRTAEEVCLLLHRKEGATVNIEKVPRFCRVSLAVDLDQKAFVAHKNSQQVLRSAWLADWQDWRCLSFFTKIARLLPRMILLPVMALIYWLFPWNSFAKSWRSPMNKFFNLVASYITFLIILHVQNDLDKNSIVRGAPNTGWEFAIMLYIFGLIWRDIKQLLVQGSDRWFAQNWNWYNLIMNLTYLTTFGLWAWAEHDVHVNGNRYLPRSHWYQYDPALLAEATMAVGTILSYGRLLYYFQIGNRLGPLQTSLSHMLRDVANFMIIFMVVVISFASGLNKIYHYYQGQVRNINGVITAQSDAFESFQSTLKTQFWALYGYSPPQYADVVIQEQVRHVGNTTVLVVNKHKFTEGCGYILFGIYNVVAIIILLNMLIAMMSTSFMNVQDNADMEWKFCRTQIWLEFFGEGGTLPPPFNMVPAPKSFYNIFHWTYHRFKGNPEAVCSLWGCCQMKKVAEEEEEDNQEYQRVMRTLVQRYLRHRDDVSDTNTATAADLEIIRNNMRDLQQTVTKLNMLIDPSNDKAISVHSSRTSYVQWSHHPNFSWDMRQVYCGLCEIGI